MKNGLILATAALLLSHPALAAEPAPAKPASEPASWVTTEDYPQEALRYSQQGTVGFRIDIGPDGAPANCTIVSSSGSQVLDKRTCELIQERAYFEPARDAKGKAVASSYINRVRWVLPVSDAPKPFDLTISFVVGADGKVTNCTSTGGEGMPANAMAGFAQGCSSAQYVPYNGPDGKPVARKVTLRMSASVDPVGPPPAGK